MSGCWPVLILLILSIKKRVQHSTMKTIIVHSVNSVQRWLLSSSSLSLLLLLMLVVVVVAWSG